MLLSPVLPGAGGGPLASHSAALELVCEEDSAARSAGWLFCIFSAGSSALEDPSSDEPARASEEGQADI